MGLKALNKGLILQTQRVMPVDTISRKCHKILFLNLKQCVDYDITVVTRNIYTPDTGLLCKEISYTSLIIYTINIAAENSKD